MATESMRKTTIAAPEMMVPVVLVAPMDTLPLGRIPSVHSLALAVVLMTSVKATAAIEVPPSVFFLTRMPAASRLKHQGGRRCSLGSRADVNICPTQK